MGILVVCVGTHINPLLRRTVVARRMATVFAIGLWKPSASINSTSAERYETGRGSTETVGYEYERTSAYVARCYFGDWMPVVVSWGKGRLHAVLDR